MEKQAHADALKARGFRTFPVVKDGKAPLFVAWQHTAGSYTDWWTNHPDSNTGVATGQGLLVLDFDGGDGQQSLDLLDGLGLPRSYRVATPSGGTHVYLAWAGTGITVSAKAIDEFPGVDVRCDGGLVVAPGSTIDGVAYQVIADEPIAEAPEWVVDFCRRAQGKVRTATSDAPLVELDTESAIGRAIDYLKGPAPTAETGNRGATTYKIAAVVREFGISEDAAADLIAEHWNPVKCDPPQDAEVVIEQVNHAYRYATGGWGSASALNDFDVVEIAPARGEGEPGPARKRLYRVRFDEAADNALARNATPLVEGLLDTAAMSIVYGDSNSGKTFLMLDIAFHIAAGLPWQGRDVLQGVVLYVAAEGGRGIMKRIAALKLHYSLWGVPLDLIPCPINLRDSKADINDLLELVKEAEAEHGKNVVLIVIDTLSRALAGGDENASTDMGAFVRNVDRLRSSVNAAVAIVHHSGKDAARGARGWSGLRAATDTEIEIAKGTITVSKQRDMEPAKEMNFTLDSVEIGKDEKGRAVTSAVVRVMSGSEFGQGDLTGEASEMFDAFVDIAKQQVLDREEDIANWEKEPVSLANWEKSYMSAREERFLQLPENKGKREAIRKSGFVAPSVRHLRRLRGAVIESGCLREVDKNQWVKA